MRTHGDVTNFGCVYYTLGRKVCLPCCFTYGIVDSGEGVGDRGIACLVTKTRIALDSTNFISLYTLNLPCQEGKITPRKNCPYSLDCGKQMSGTYVWLEIAVS